jgi:hypothetical protein
MHSTYLNAIHATEHKIKERENAVKIVTTLQTLRHDNDILLSHLKTHTRGKKISICKCNIQNRAPKKRTVECCT